MLRLTIVAAAVCVTSAWSSRGPIRFLAARPTRPSRPAISPLLQQPETPDTANADSAVPAAVPAAPEAPQASEAQVDVLDRAQDPFRAVRLIIFGIFAIVGLAGVGVALSQVPSDPAGSLTNLVVNGGVLAIGVGAFIFDQRVQAQLKEKLEEDLSSPYLKGGERTPTPTPKLTPTLSLALGPL